MAIGDTRDIKIHPSINTFGAEWLLYLQAYEGTGPFLDRSALFQFTREEETTYANRKALAFYPNYCAPVTDIKTSAIFEKDDIFRSFEFSKLLTLLPDTGFIDNVDLRGSHINEFMTEVATLAQVFGFCPVLVDSQRKPDTPLISRKDQMDANLVPYFTIISPLNLINWDTDRFGALKWILFKQEDVKDEQSGAVVKSIFKFFNRELWQTIESTDKSISITEEQTHNLNAVPVISFRNQEMRGDPFLGLSAIRDIAKVNRSLMNKYNELDLILRGQTFSIFIYPENKIFARTGTKTEDDPVARKEIGPSNAFGFPPDSTHTPAFISPDSAQGELYRNVIQDYIKEIYRLARLEQIGESATRQDVASGISQAYRFKNTNSNIASIAKQLERGERHLWELWAAWQDADFTGVVTYPSDFNVQDLNQQIEVALAVQTTKIPSETYYREFYKQFANATLQTMDDTIQQKINKEIDAAEIDLEPEPPEAGLFGEEMPEEEMAMAGQGNNRNGRSSVPNQ